MDIADSDTIFKAQQPHKADPGEQQSGQESSTIKVINPESEATATGESQEEPKKKRGRPQKLKVEAGGADSGGAGTQVPQNSPPKEVVAKRKPGRPRKPKPDVPVSVDSTAVEPKKSEAEPVVHNTNCPPGGSLPEPNTQASEEGGRPEGSALQGRSGFGEQHNVQLDWLQQTQDKIHLVHLVCYLNYVRLMAIPIRSASTNPESPTVLVADVVKPYNDQDWDQFDKLTNFLDKHPLLFFDNHILGLYLHLTHRRRNSKPIKLNHVYEMSVDFTNLKGVSYSKGKTGKPDPRTLQRLGIQALVRSSRDKRVCLTLSAMLAENRIGKDVTLPEAVLLNDYEYELSDSPWFNVNQNPGLEKLMDHLYHIALQNIPQWFELRINLVRLYPNQYESLFLVNSTTPQLVEPVLPESMKGCEKKPTKKILTKQFPKLADPPGL